MHVENEKELARQIAEGNETAYKVLFDTYWDHIYSVAFVLTKSSAYSEDIVQEIFLKIWRKRQELATVEKLESYLFIIARNYIYDELKKQHREVKFRKQLLNWFEENSSRNPEQELLFNESNKLLELAIKRLTPQQQLIYKMTREQGLSHLQVAEKLNISTNTVRNHIVNSLKTIREYLNEHASPLLLLIVLFKTLSK